MNLSILQLAEKPLRWLLIIVSIIALIRGHNYPGGGFIGGLLAGLAIVLQGLAYGLETVKQNLKISPQNIIGSGLTVVLLSLIPSIINQNALMKAYWIKIDIISDISIKIGTPFIFDLGVFLVVIGVVLNFIFYLNK